MNAGLFGKGWRVITMKNSGAGFSVMMMVAVMVLGMAGSGQAASGKTLGGYQPYPVNVQPCFPDVPIDQSLANVINVDQTQLSPHAWEMLERNGFVVVPSWHEEFFPIYQANVYDISPSFITTDSVLHNVHLMFSYLLRSTEGDFFIPVLQSLSRDLLAAGLRWYALLAGTEWENAARRNVGFFAVGNALLDPGATIPAAVRPEVETELALIYAHQGIAGSPVMNMALSADTRVAYPDGTLGLLANREDYSQYIPRGHYGRSDDFQRYFRAMMWYGRLTFRFAVPDELRSAVLVTALLEEGERGEAWKSLFDPISFLVGVSDDITYPVFRDLLVEVYGSVPGVSSLANRVDLFDRLQEEVRLLDPPQLNSIPIFDATIQPDRHEAVQGFRFLGQRFTIDADIFQRLIYREVMENPYGQRRMLPRGLDIPAAFGSEVALSILVDLGDTEYDGYPRNMSTLQASLAALPLSAWTQNFYWSWMYSLLPLITEKPEGYPAFMRTRPWQKKELVTFLGSWAELKHDTVLYAKQVYAQLGGPPPEEQDDRGFVEPNPELYGRVASLLCLVREGLDQLGFLTEADQVNLARLADIALTLKTISEKQLTGVLPTEEEFDFIRYYGGMLEHFWLETLRDEGIESISQLSERPGALITDVATDPSGQVLQVGTGYVSRIYVIVPVDGTLRITQGGVYSYYEFPWPMEDRLTDARWHQMLFDSETPVPPAWTADFVSYQYE